jgi:LPXTG-motif cell wall-anchored protein
VSGQRAFYQQAPGAYGRCVVSDFDERPRYPIEQTNLAAIRWFPDQSIDLFRRAVRNAREDVVASTRPQTVDNLVLFYAWNEWHEGGIIEPNARDGCAYLDAIRQELGLVGGSGCTPGAPPPSSAMSAPPTPASPGGSSATTAAGSTSTPSTPASGREVAARRETGDDLPDTGSDLTLPLVGVGAALLATGTGTVLGVRRRRRRLAG